ncbi:MAG TPA: ABC transporter substrate-binding protein [Thermoanaerobaculia bacterium]|nr:ABC transporter substrate-binding protein [Thermoanaerobaculia bacterium]
MKKRTFLSLGLAAFAAAGSLLAPGCGRKGDLPTINVGLIADLTGSRSAFGASSKNAAEMKVARIDEQGGIAVGGTKYDLKLVIVDSQCTAEGAVAAAQTLIKEDTVIALVGPITSLEAVPVAEAAEAARVPMITPGSTAPKTTLDATTGQPKKWVFRTCFTDAWQGAVLAKFADGYVRAKKAAVLYDPASEAPKIQAELFKQDFEKTGGAVVAFETYKSGESDYTAVFAKIRKAAPDVVFLPGYYNDVAVQLAQAHAAGLTVPFLGSDNWGSVDFLKLAGKNAEGAFYSAHYQPDRRNELTGGFVISYKKRFGDQVPDDVAALTWDAFGLLSEALGKAGKPDRQLVRDALAGIREYEGATGRMKFPAGSGDPVKTTVMYKVEGGKPAFVTNIEP